MLDWNGYWDGGLNDEEHTSSSRGWWPSIERQHGALVEEERLLEAGGKPARTSAWRDARRRALEAQQPDSAGQ